MYIVLLFRFADEPEGTTAVPINVESSLINSTMYCMFLKQESNFFHQFLLSPGFLPSSGNNQQE